MKIQAVTGARQQREHPEWRECGQAGVPLTPSPLPLMASTLAYHIPGHRHHASPSPGLQAL